MTYDDESENNSFFYPSASLSWVVNESLQIDINNRSGVILNSSIEISELGRVELCEKAWRFWANDSFWINPISKIFDSGTSRSIVMQEDGSKSLLVTY